MIFPRTSLLAALAQLWLMLPAFASTTPPPNPSAGQSSFKKCASCHQVGPGAKGGFGPQLNAIIGRRAASTTDFNYSPALKNSNIVWSEQTLAAFLKAPGDVVPGNKMRFVGIGDEQQIANLIAYLKTFP